VSADAGNASVLGTDGLIFTPAGGGGGLVTAPSVAGFPAAGEPNKVYLAEDTGDTFRFDATARGTDTYVRISERVLSTGIEDSTFVGRDVLTSATTRDARAAIGEYHRAEISTSFVGKPDGSPQTKGDEGVPVKFETIPSLVKDGLLQSPNLTGTPTTRASYWNQPLPAAKRIGATFKLSSGTGGNVSIALVFWEYMFPSPYKVPNSPMHLIVNANGWELAVFHSGNQTTDATFVSIGSGVFATPLAADWNPSVAGSGTLHRVEALVDGSSVVISLPNGSVVRASDARVASIPANVACHEHYRGVSTAGFVAIEELWSSKSASLPIGAVDFSSTQFLANKTLSTSTLKSPRVEGTILDVNGNNSLVIGALANAVNHFQLVNTPTGVNPVIIPAGPSANLNLDLRPKGSGSVIVTDSAGLNTIGFNRPTSGTAANYWLMYSARAGSDVIAAAAGSDTDIGINVVPKGAGKLKSAGIPVVTGTDTSRPALRLWAGTKASYDSLVTAGAVDANTIYVVTTAAATLEGIVEGVTGAVDTGNISSAEPVVPDAVQDVVDAVQTGDIVVDPPARTATTKSTRKK
jgi:hypothetical protein